MRTPIRTLLGAASALLVSFGVTHHATAQPKALSLPAHAQEIEPGVYYLGRVKDRAGRDIDGIAFVWGVFNGSPAGRELTEWDVVLRDNVDWSATGEPGKYDFWGVFAHESCHAAGMAHPSDTCTEETMYRFAGLGETKKRTLNDGDIAGIAALYK